MKIYSLLLAVFWLAACNPKSETNLDSETQKSFIPVNDSIIASAIIYEVNIRQFSPEGTFKAFTQHLPELKKLGVKFIWLMPIHPISEKNRKGHLGSPYAVSDYKKIHPDYGTLEDFKTLVQTAHQNDMYVLLDWVPNHTGWDHRWIGEHPDFYTHNDEGEIIDPINPETGKSWGWTDVADLNYNHPALRDSMIQQMLYWVREENIDGFRCDVAGAVPTDFWKRAIDSLRSVKPVFMLAEAEKPELLKAGFDMQYAREALHIINSLALGNKTIADWDAYMEALPTRLEADDILMNFTSNHDENAWNGTVFERLNHTVEIFTVLTYLSPGMPMIYNGQEYDLKKRLAFFEKDTIPHIKGKMYPLYEKLGQLKAHHPALGTGKNHGTYRRIPTSKDHQVLAFERTKGNQKVVFAGNFSADTLTINLDIQGKFQDYLESSSIVLNPGKPVNLLPWSYYIWTN